MNDSFAAWPACPSLPCSWGDAFDRLTILDLKRSRLTDREQSRRVADEHAAVEAAIGDLGRFPPGLVTLVADLAAINAGLWNTEDAIRSCEAEGRFGDDFVILARRVYIGNAERARIKHAISLLLGSALIEQKQYGSAT